MKLDMDLTLIFVYISSYITMKGKYSVGNLINSVLGGLVGITGKRVYLFLKICNS